MDIETIPTEDESVIKQITDSIKPPGNIKKAETIEEWEKNDKPQAVKDAIQKTALNGAYGRIACIGIAIDDSDIRCASELDEAKILRGVFDFMEDEYAESRIGGRPVFIGHNLTDFDLRFIFHRAVILGVKPPAFFPINARSWSTEIFDTMTYWAGHGNRISLDNLCKALGIEGKSTEYTWENVYPSFKAGDFSAIGEYCMSDVDKARQIYKRLTFQ